ncbi:MAG TPA: hypothetical protein VKA61_09470, partial [Sphingomicrobium sp.]|nr:hypothetical protein [Sphingomicrobium sp.]
MSLLGRFAISGTAGPLGTLQISSRKGCAIIAYLAMRPDFRADRERLATLLWGDRPDKQARHSLRQCLTSLRQDLAASRPELLFLPGEIVALDADAISVDALDFEAL